ncbi:MULTISPECIES: glycosyltransferase family 4 protein [Flavobacterium]|uniref:Glycosyltransferase family 4 protein n=1 Tax=Flavobacterium hankyongi TaxID=1176532 RepID=A0ABP9A1R5_9FLAO|nr:glycosyltransferase family 4 protein [Flavobacterium sp. N1846]
MHICFITHEYPKPGFPHGGLGSFVKTIGEALAANGIQVSVVGMNYTSEYEELMESGVRIYRLNRSKLKGLSWWMNSKAVSGKIREIHKHHPIDIVESAESGLAFLSKIKDIQYVIRLHGGHYFFAEAENRGINWWKGFQEKRSFAKADAFIAVSKYVKNHTEKYLSYHNKPLGYINNPINTAVFKPMLNDIIPHKIVFAGTICEKKGVRQLIQAFPLVKEEFPDATLHLYGRDWFFPDGASFVAFLKEKELPRLGPVAESVFFQGVLPLSEVAKKYAEAEVCVFPSHMETLGLVAPEAMAIAKPVVFTNRGPGPEIITDTVTGLLCNPLDPNDIAQKILRIFTDKAAASAMGKNAEKEVQKRFSVSELVAENIDFFKSLSKK